MQNRLAVFRAKEVAMNKMKVLMAISLLGILPPRWSFGWTKTAVPTSKDEAVAQGYVTQKAADVWANSSAYLSDDATAGKIWQDGQAIHSGAKYYLTTTTIGKEETTTLNGSASDVFIYYSGSHSFRKETTLDFTSRPVVFCPNVTLTHYNAGLTVKAAAFEVQSTATKPLTISMNTSHAAGSSTRNSYWMAPWKGDENARVVFKLTNSEGARSVENLIGDLSNYAGTFAITGNGQTTTESARLVLALGCGNFPGGVELSDHTELAVASKNGPYAPSVGSVKVADATSSIGVGANSLSVGNLDIAAGSSIFFGDGTDGAAGTLTVTEAFMVSGKGKVLLDFAGAPKLFPFSYNTSSTFPARRYPLVRFKTGLPISTNTFEVVNLAVGSYGLPHVYLKEEDDETEGYKVISLVSDPVVIVIGAGVTPTTADKYSDNLPMHDKVEYYGKWYGLSLSVDSTGSLWEFPGSCYTTIGTIQPVVRETRFGRLVLQAREPSNTSLPAIDVYGQGDEVREDPDSLQVLSGGTVELRSYADGSWALCAFTGYLDRHFRVDSRMTGSGNLQISAKTGVSNPRFRCELNADNSGFSGKIRVTTANYAGDGSKPAAPTDTYCATLLVGAQENLGGARDEFTPDALLLMQKSRFVPKNDMTLDRRYNRGVSVLGEARLEIGDGITLTLNTPLSYGGNVRKTGAGRLVLGEAAQFIRRKVLVDEKGNASNVPGVETIEAPVATSNVLTVAQGVVAVTHPEALNGVEAHFATGTGLVLPSAQAGGAASDDLAARGLVLTRWETPFVAEGDEKVNVSFDVVDDPDRKGWRQTLLTASSAERLAAIASNLAFVRPRHFKMSMETVSNADGTASLVATFESTGLVIIYR